MHLKPQILENRFVRLEPLAERHREQLRAPADDPETWRFFPFRADGAHYDAAFDGRMVAHKSGAWIAHAVCTPTGAVGMTCYLNIDRGNARLEIGGTWYGAGARGGPVNPACKRLLLQSAFEAGARRVEFKTDARNLRSRAAIAKLGAVEEGTLRRHTLMWDGYVRDTVYFSVLDHEWPAVRARLDARLAAF